MPDPPNVSTHAPRAGSDHNQADESGRDDRFNSRSPSGERLARSSSPDLITKFQLTLPERGATGGLNKPPFLFAFQLTLPERGATRIRNQLYPRLRVSTHAPRAGSDPRKQRKLADYGMFQLTLPERGATRAGTQRGCS